MTIERGKPWGTAMTVPPDRVIVHSDEELARCNPLETAALAGGDIWRSLGSPQPLVIGAAATCVHIDALEISIVTNDGEKDAMAASSVEVGRWFSRSRYICVANSSFLGSLNIAPRAHPNDGVVDVITIDATMSLRQRLAAQKRARTGTHLPHPSITATRVTTFQTSRVGRNEILRVDGEQVQHWDSVSITVRPDYWQVLI